MPPRPPRIPIPKSVPPAPLPPRPKAYKPRPSPDSSNPSKKPLSTAYRYRLLIGGAAAGGIALYITLIATQWRADMSRFPADSVPQDTSARYNFIADDFDSSVETTEWMIGLTRRRRELCRLARGHVLEASAGTGRNATAYNLADRRPETAVRSVTMVDKSREMLDVARRKWPECGNAWFIHAIFRVADLAVPGTTVPVPKMAAAEERQQRFDTVVQTMGLCSTGEPVALLRNLGEMCEPEGGRVLLLEHGKGHYEWLNSLLDRMAPSHAHRYGCWFNKDIGEIVRQSGLEIVEEKRFNFGTTWWYVLKPGKDMAEAAAAAEKSGITTGGATLTEGGRAVPSDGLAGAPWSWFRWWSSR